jgi:hypothetical protein
MGGASLAARSGHRVAAATAVDILMVTPTGSMLRMFRGGLDQGGGRLVALPAPVAAEFHAR